MRSAYDLKKAFPEVHFVSPFRSPLLISLSTNLTTALFPRAPSRPLARVPQAELHVTLSGHSGFEPLNIARLVEATDRFKRVYDNIDRKPFQNPRQSHCSLLSLSLFELISFFFSISISLGKVKTPSEPSAR